MALTRVYGRVVYPHGNDAPTPVTGDGVIEYVHATPGIIDGAVHGPDRKRIGYVAGVAEDAWLKPGMWRAYVYPNEGRSYTLHLGIPEGGDVTLADVVGEVVPEGIVTKGDPGEPGEPGEPGRDGQDGQDGHTPEITFDGTTIVVDGVPGPNLKGEPGEGGGGIAGAVPIFETLAEAEAWEAANPGKTALTLEGQEPVGPVDWEAAAPSFDVVAGTYTIPDDEGATYTIDGVTVAAGVHQVTPPVTVTVVAVAKPGYSLVGVTEWVQGYVEIESPYDAEAVKAPVYLRLDETAPVDRDDLVNRGTAEVVPWYLPGKTITTANFGAASVGVGTRAVLNRIGSQIFTVPANGPYTLAATFGEVTATGFSVAALVGAAQVVRNASTGAVYVYGYGVNTGDIKPMPERLHVAVTVNAGTAKVYLDGVEVISAAFTGANGDVGVPSVGESGRVGGVVLDPTRAWSGAEILALSNAVQR